MHAYVRRGDGDGQLRSVGRVHRNHRHRARQLLFHEGLNG